MPVGGIQDQTIIESKKVKANDLDKGQVISFFDKDYWEGFD